MSSNVAIEVSNISKCYQIYESSKDRFKEFFVPKLNRLLNRKEVKYYKEYWALHDVSFKINKGQTVGVIGRNGSGKSTLLQIICGTLNPSGGSVHVHGRVAALLELGSGFNPEFTGLENIYLGANILGLSKQEIDKRLQSIMDFADIGEFLSQPVKTYSSGMTVRLAFSLIAHVDADILIIDEALAVGDAFFTQKCMRFLRKFMETGTVLFVSHDTASIKSLCNFAVWLDEGRLIQSGDPELVCNSYMESVHTNKIIDSSQFGTRHQLYVPNVDVRSDLIDSSNLANRISVFEFNPDSPRFGEARALISGVLVRDKNGDPCNQVLGGELVTLEISCSAQVDVESIIIGFYFKDRLGQYIFGDNTFLTYSNDPISLRCGEKCTAAFGFYMPRLSKGHYSICAAVATGNQEDHAQQDWVHDAVILESAESSVSGGMVGIPMTSIKIARII
jgi:lipopolysaccharide transport system ATP-binding protein